MKKRNLWIVIILIFLGIIISCWAVRNNSEGPKEKSVVIVLEEYEKIPLNFIRSHEGYFLVLSGEPLLLEFRFGEKDRDRFIYFYNENIFEVKEVKSEGVKIQYREYRGKKGIDTFVRLQRKKPNGWVRFSLVPKLYRRKLDINSLTICRDYNRPLSDYLEEEEKLEVNSPEVKGVAVEIRQSLKPSQRDNPYFLIKSTLTWLDDNITYSLVPKHLVDAFTEVVEKMPLERRTLYPLLFELRDLIQKILPEEYKDEITDEILSNWSRAYLNFYVYEEDLPINDAYELSFKFLNRICKISSFVFRAAWHGYETSAENTLKDRMARCTGLSYAFVAICRSFGIPADETSGYTGLHHAWAIVYLHPYGWVEADPTNGKFDDFPYHQYAYSIVWLLEKDNVEVSAYKLVDKNTRK